MSLSTAGLGPAGTLRLRSGDRHVLIGLAELFGTCPGLFRESPGADAALHGASWTGGFVRNAQWEYTVSAERWSGEKPVETCKKYDADPLMISRPIR